VVSCDTYYFMLANDLGVDRMHDFMKQFGFGELSGIDLANERAGLLPSTAWKRAAFKSPERKRWVLGDTISLGIGQGYNSFTPMEIAKAVATLSNNGVMMKPHLVKAIESGATLERTAVAPVEESRVNARQEDIDFVKQAMVGVASEPGGTGYGVFHNAEYTSGGKTGTAQVVGLKKNEKYNKNGTERFRDNALYTAFAPADHPRIALAVVVENGNHGAESAAPIARAALDYYLLGKKPGGKDAVVPPKPDSNDDDAPDPDTQPDDAPATMPPSTPDAEGKRP
jgi:penicillin-binding protein 2